VVPLTLTLSLGRRRGEGKRRTRPSSTHDCAEMRSGWRLEEAAACLRGTSRHWVGRRPRGAAGAPSLTLGFASAQLCWRSTDTRRRMLYNRIEMLSAAPLGAIDLLPVAIGVYVVVGLLVAGATLLMLRWPGSAGGGNDSCVSGQGHRSKAAKRARSCRAARSRTRRTAPGVLRGIGTFRRRNPWANSGRSARQAVGRDGSNIAVPVLETLGQGDLAAPLNSLRPRRLCGSIGNGDSHRREFTTEAQRGSAAAKAEGPSHAHGSNERPGRRAADALLRSAGGIPNNEPPGPTLPQPRRSSNVPP